MHYQTPGFRLNKRESEKKPRTNKTQRKIKDKATECLNTANQSVLWTQCVKMQDRQQVIVLEWEMWVERFNDQGIGGEKKFTEQQVQSAAKAEN